MSNEPHSQWAKRIAHSDPGMAYLRRAIAVAAKQIGAVSLHVVSEEQTQEVFDTINQKTIAQAVKWVLEIDGPVGFNLFIDVKNSQGAWIGAYFDGVHTMDNYPEIIQDYSDDLILPTG